MILNVVQTKTSFNMEWVSYLGEDVFSIARSPFEKGRFTINVEFKNAPGLKMYYNPSDTTWGSKLADRMSFKLFEGEEKIGSIVGQSKKVGFLKACPYYAYEYKGTMYYGYEVGFGRKGLYLCVYEGEKLIAIVDKKLRVVNFKDTYTIYLEDEKYAPVVIPFTLYYDSATYGDVMEIALVSVEQKWVNTIYKELIAKFDPAFIPTVLALEEEKNKAT